MTLILCTIASALGLTLLLYVTTTDDLPNGEGF